MNNFKTSLSKEIKLLLILFLFIFKFNDTSAQSPCACASVSTSSDPCPQTHFANLAAAQAANSPTAVTPNLDFSTSGTSYVFCTKYTTAANETKTGLQNYVGTPLVNPSNMSRIQFQAFPINGCSSPITGTIVSTSPGIAAEFVVSPNTEYKFCLTIQLNSNSPGGLIDKIEMYTYTAGTTTPPPGCTSTVGTVTVSGATANGSEWDLSTGGALTLTGTGYTLPPASSSVGCAASYGYIVFNQAPTFPITNIANLSSLPGYKTVTTGITLGDNNSAGKSTSISGATKLWFVPFTADCKVPGSPVVFDDNTDLCYSIGTTATVVNYLNTPPPSTTCGTCATPTCPISSTTDVSSTLASLKLSNILDSIAAIGANDPMAYNANSTSNSSYTNYYKITITNTRQILGMKQKLSAIPLGSCATRTYTLVSTCGGAVITPTILNANNVSSGINPEWFNLPVGNYTLSITTTSPDPSCQIDFSVTGYYLVNIPCPVDQSFIKLDWAQSNPFVPFPSTTYTCSSGPQTIWKDVEENQISNGGQLSGATGFFMEIITDASSDTKTSALVSVNGTAYSYYGPAGTAPSGVLDWGKMATPPNYQNIIEPYLAAGATVTVKLCDTRASAQSFKYKVYDLASGVLLTNGTATPSSSSCTTITFTLSSPTMTWKLDGGSANIIDNHNGSATFNPSNLTSGSHTIDYTWTNGLGCTLTASKTINVGVTTLAPTTAPVAYCQGATASALIVTTSANCTLNWYGTNQTGGTASSTSPTPLTTGTGTTTYYVSQTNTTTTCESPRASIVVTINPNPTLSITDPATVCIPSTVDITAAAVTSGSTTGGTFTYFINPGATTALPTPAAVSNSGTYYIKSTVNSCSTVLPVTVLINNCACPYNIAITTPAATCSPNTVDITDPAVTAGSVGGGTLSYWSDQACTNSITTVAAAAISASGTYYIKGDNGVCNDTKPVVVTINTTPSLTIVNPTAVCSPNTINITLPAVTAGSSGNGTLSYWNDAGAVNSALATPNAVTTSNTYYIKSANGICQDIKPVVVTINPLPLALPIYSASYCQNAATSPISTTASAGCTLNWYQNLTGGTLTNITPTVSSSTVGVNSYYVTQTDANGCESASPRTKIDINVTAIPVVTVNSPSVCYGDSITLTATGATTYSWDIGWAQGVSNSNPFKDKTLINAKYKVRGTTNGCSSSAIADITIKPLPTLVYQDSLSICFPGSVDLTSSEYTIGSTPLSTFDYFINKTGTSPLTGASTIETDGVYYIQSTLNGCKSKIDSVVVNIQQKPAVYFTPSPAVVTTTNPVSTMINGTIGGSTYFWNFGDTGTSIETKPEHTFPNIDTSTYQITLVAISKDGCIDSLKKSVKVIEDLLYYVPNSFTPDGDQYNQEFKPIFTSGFDHKGYQLLIFDRWGNLVFETTDYTKGWDGKRLGSKEKVQDGTYTWKILFSIKSDDRREEIHGHVTIVR